MGVYIIIRGEYPCPQCGKKLADWQKHRDKPRARQSEPNFGLRRGPKAKPMNAGREALLRQDTLDQSLQGRSTQRLPKQTFCERDSDGGDGDPVTDVTRCDRVVKFIGRYPTN